MKTGKVGNNLFILFILLIFYRHITSTVMGRESLDLFEIMSNNEKQTRHATAATSSGGNPCDVNRVCYVWFIVPKKHKLNQKMLLNKHAPINTIPLK